MRSARQFAILLRKEKEVLTIAIYHCSIKIISRGKGKSAVAAAAYRSGEKLTNDYDGTTHDFTRKGGVVHTEILLPDNAPREYSDRSTLWNAVEVVEKSKNAQLSREIEIALPNELSEIECIALAKEFAQRTFVDKGIIEKVDHRSFERQGKIKKPTVHMGVAATQMERKGIRTVKGDTNREIKSINAKISALLKRIDVLDDALAKMKDIPKEDSLLEMLMLFHDNGIKFSEVRGVSVSNLKKISKFKDLTHLIAFVQGNNIGTLSELAEKNSETKSGLKNYKSKLISTQKRMKELTELLDNYPRYKENKAVYLEWQSITNLKQKEKFYDKHYGEITLFKTAKSFYDSNLNGAKLTPKAWQRELEELTKSAEVDRAKVEKLGDDVAVMETLIYNVQRLTNYEEKQNEIQRRRTAELE